MPNKKLPFNPVFKLLPTVFYYTGQSDISHDIVNRHHQFLSKCKFSSNQIIDILLIGFSRILDFSFFTSFYSFYCNLHVCCCYHFMVNKRFNCLELSLLSLHLLGLHHACFLYSDSYLHSLVLSPLLDVLKNSS